MELFDGYSLRIEIVGIVVAVFAIAAASTYLFFTKKSKGMIIFFFLFYHLNRIAGKIIHCRPFRTFESSSFLFFFFWGGSNFVLGCLDPENFKNFKLVERKQLSHNVAKFRFALPTPASVLGLPIGQHISCR